MVSALGVTSTTRVRLSKMERRPDTLLWDQQTVGAHLDATRANAVLALRSGDRVIWAITPPEFNRNAVGTIMGFCDDEVQVRFPAEAMRQTFGDICHGVDTRREFVGIVRPDSLVPTFSMLI